MIVISVLKGEYDEIQATDEELSMATVVSARNRCFLSITPAINCLSIYSYSVIAHNLRYDFVRDICTPLPIPSFRLVLVVQSMPLA
ncbi:hypothetical protein [Bacillus alkalicola]|uniref:Uncharacterized protein n=1 Tax=Evansella alkalicola TaxID=745819 RepID=A0ABS6JTP2_9BACI|nr:hypothetical protein [Bacillus alkalicola]